MAEPLRLTGLNIGTVCQRFPGRNSSSRAAPPPYCTHTCKFSFSDGFVEQDLNGAQIYALLQKISETIVTGKSPSHFTIYNQERYHHLNADHILSGACGREMTYPVRIITPAPPPPQGYIEFALSKITSFVRFFWRKG